MWYDGDILRSGEWRAVEVKDLDHAYTGLECQDKMEACGTFIGRKMMATSLWFRTPYFVYKIMANGHPVHPDWPREELWRDERDSATARALSIGLRSRHQPISLGGARPADPDRSEVVGAPTLKELED